jgi:low temperature requirement protein LtrA
MAVDPSQHPERRLGGARWHEEGHRPTNAELLWDLVYAFALTQVTALIARAHDGDGVVRGLLVLALLWWSWVAFAWLGNRAHGGYLRAGSMVAMAGMFVVALTIPQAWHYEPGGLYGPIAVVCAYAVVRTIHLVLAGLAAAEDTAMRREIYRVYMPVVAALGLLLVGAFVGEVAQTALFAVAVLIDWGGTYLIVLLVALGSEGVIFNAETTRPLGVFFALSLFGGAAVYFGGQVLFKYRLHRQVNRPRLAVAVLVLAAAPLAALVLPLAALAGFVAIVAGLSAFEALRYRTVRRHLREA